MTASRRYDQAAVALSGKVAWPWNVASTDARAVPLNHHYQNSV
jgi:hypothetical protein